MIFIVCDSTYGQFSEVDSAYFYFKRGVDFSNKNQTNLAFKNHIKAKEIYKKLNLKDSIANSNIELFYILESKDTSYFKSKIYLHEFYKYVKEKKDTTLQIKAFFMYAEHFFNTDSISISANYYKKIIKLSKKDTDKATSYGNLGLLYTKKIPDSSEFFFKKSISKYKKQNTTELFSSHLNFANFYEQQKQYKKAIEELSKAEKIKPEKFEKKLKEILYKKFSNIFFQIKNYRKAYKYLKKYNVYKDSLNNIQQNISIKEIQEKYDNEKLKADNLESESKRKQNKNLFYGALVILFFTGIIYYQNLKNSKRKRLLAEQQKELEQQKNITLLKEQEITTINAMVDGQEKERIRIAEDLHDNIGSVLATLKLHFENLKFNREKKTFNQEDLYNKTENLIDEAYLKVRSIAHAKNAGVIANKGLLVAVKIMAEKISDANKINIEVLDYGLDKRLENTIELTVFRIIQELTTNVIKHAAATQATINLSLYDDNLNIIVEDNGKGFSLKKVDFKSEGMGLGSIETRVKYLNGTFDVDATLGKGSSILINIPV